MTLVKKLPKVNLPKITIYFDFLEHRKLVLPLVDKKLVIDFDDIVYIEADSNYAIVHTKEISYTLSKTLKWFQEKLDHQFYRVHHSFLVNLKEVKVLATKDHTIHMSSEVKLPIARSKRKGLNALFSASS